MVKRTAAYAFLLLANILFLAHAVVPHHHHNGNNICLIKDHCSGDNLHHGHGDEGESHNHDGDDNSDNCVLKTPVALPTDLNKTDFHLTPNSSGDSDHDSLYDNILNSSFLKLPVLAAFVFERSGTCFYRSQVSASPGLRAPPVA